MQWKRIRDIKRKTNDLNTRKCQKLKKKTLKIKQFYSKKVIDMINKKENVFTLMSKTVTLKNSVDKYVYFF